jgi:hypothetical protein
MPSVRFDSYQCGGWQTCEDDQEIGVKNMSFYDFIVSVDVRTALMGRMRRLPRGEGIACQMLLHPAAPRLRR